MFITNIIFILSILFMQADSNIYFYCTFNGDDESFMYIMTKKLNNETKDVELNFTDWNIFINKTTNITMLETFNKDIKKQNSSFFNNYIENVSNPSERENYENKYNDTEKQPNLRHLRDYVKNFLTSNNNSLHFNMYLLMILFVFLI